MKRLVYLTFIWLCQYTTLAQTIDTKHLFLNLNFDWHKKQVSGIAEITFNTDEDSDQVHLDAAFMTIQSITLNEQLVNFEYQSNDAPKNLKVQLDRIYNPSEVIKLIIEYHSNYENRSDPQSIGGSFGKGLRFFQPTTTTPMKRKQIWSNGEPANNKYWFPCNEDYC
jgi:aminopeptidase N